MPRPRNPVPTYRHHKQSGQAIVTLRDGAGRRYDRLLGPYNSPESLKEYGRLIGELDRIAPARAKVAPVVTPTARGKQSDITVAEVWHRFLTEHALTYYRRPDGTPTSEIAVFRAAVKVLIDVYGRYPAAEFGAEALEDIRGRVIQRPPRHGTVVAEPAKLSRATVNGYISRIKLVFRWACKKRLIPATVTADLELVDGLAEGRSAARETEPVDAVPDAFVDGVLDYVGRTIRGMIELQRLTGMRPAEVCKLRRIEIDSRADVWVYRPAQHKNSWRAGKSKTSKHARSVFIGPRAQAVLTPFLTTNLEAYVFPPQRCDVAGHQPHYNKDSYARAVVRGIDKANAARVKQAEADGIELQPHELIPRWSPNQLRHSCGTEVRRQFGLEGAQVILGHKHADTTQIYAERNNELGATIARQIG